MLQTVAVLSQMLTSPWGSEEHAGVGEISQHLNTYICTLVKKGGAVPTAVVAENYQGQSRCILYPQEPLWHLKEILCDSSVKDKSWKEKAWCDFWCLKSETFTQY